MELETLDACDLCGSHRIRSLDPAISVCECESCGFVFDNPRPSQREIARFYSRPTKYDSWLNEEHARDLLWKRRLKKMRKTRKDGSLLDIGTGIGQFLHHAKPFYRSVTGTEVSESAILIAREKYNLDVIHGKIEDVQFGDGKFDNITLFHVLEHVPNPRVVIERCRDLLTPGGILVVAVPNDILSLKLKRNGIRGVLKRIMATESEIIRNLSLPRITLDESMDEIHVSHFTPEVLHRFLEASGFFVLENSLDPCYALTGMSKLKQDLKYVGCALLKFFLKRNVYDSIWIAAKKN